MKVNFVEIAELGSHPWVWALAYLSQEYCEGGVISKIHVFGIEVMESRYVGLVHLSLLIVQFV